MNATLRARAGTFALLLASCAVASCDGLLSEFERDPDSVPPSEILELTRTGGALPLRADGESRDTLEARIPANASTRVVTFTTSAGSFALNPGGNQIQVRAEPSGDPHDRRLLATTVLVAGTEPGTAVVSASVGEFTRYLEIPLLK